MILESVALASMVGFGVYTLSRTWPTAKREESSDELVREARGILGSTCHECGGPTSTLRMRGAARVVHRCADCGGTLTASSAAVATMTRHIDVLAPLVMNAEAVGYQRAVPPAGLRGRRVWLERAETNDCLCLYAHPTGITTERWMRVNNNRDYTLVSRDIR